MTDKYDEEIGRLEKLPFSAVHFSWNTLGPLFAFAGKGAECGCLTEVRCGSLSAATPELTEEIRADERIPKRIEDMEEDWRKGNRRARQKLLAPFAFWQRRLDREIRGAR